MASPGVRQPRNWAWEPQQGRLPQPLTARAARIPAARWKGDGHSGDQGGPARCSKLIRVVEEMGTRDANATAWQDERHSDRNIP